MLKTTPNLALFDPPVKIRAISIVQTPEIQSMAIYYVAAEHGGLIKNKVHG